VVKYEQDGQAKSFREFVAVIQDDVNGLQLTGQGGIISTSEVPGGQRGFGSEVSLAPRVVQVTGEDAVLFANPVDKVMYYLPRRHGRADGQFHQLRPPAPRRHGWTAACAASSAFAAAGTSASLRKNAWRRTAFGTPTKKAYADLDRCLHDPLSSPGARPARARAHDLSLDYGFGAVDVFGAGVVAGVVVVGVAGAGAVVAGV